MGPRVLLKLGDAMGSRAGSGSVTGSGTPRFPPFSAAVGAAGPQAPCRGGTVLGKVAKGKGMRGVRLAEGGQQLGSRQRGRRGGTPVVSMRGGP